MAIAAIVWFDPDSLVKLIAEERAQKTTQQTADMAVQPTDTATYTTAQPTETSTDIEVTDENDTTN